MAKTTTKTDQETGAEVEAETGTGTGAKNGAAVSAAEALKLDPELGEKLTKLRSTLRENFGKVVMALMMLPRYRNQMLSDLQHLVLDPMLQDRIAIAYPNTSDQPGAPDMAGFGIWASVSEEVDAKIRDQIASGVFPIRLKPEEWNSGKINWLLDVIAQDKATITTVIANFRQVVKEGELRLHPLITRLVDPDVLEKMGAKRTAEAAGTPAEAEAEN